MPWISEMQRFGARFDHNLHAVRIVETFEQRYARFPGLNLSFEVREGIAKHSRDFGPGENPDLEEYLPGSRPPLEAQLIDLADEIAYNTADLDDAIVGRPAAPRGGSRGGALLRGSSTRQPSSSSPARRRAHASTRRCAA